MIEAKIYSSYSSGDFNVNMLLFLNIYIFTYFIDSQQRKLAIFRCLNMTKADSVAFILFKIVILLVLAIPLGLMLGYGISWIAVFLFNRFIGLDHSIALSGKAVGISIFICVVTVFWVAYGASER